jgi:hypothetical protein
MKAKQERVQVVNHMILCRIECEEIATHNNYMM